MWWCIGKQKCIIRGLCNQSLLENEFECKWIVIQYTLKFDPFASLLLTCYQIIFKLVSI